MKGPEALGALLRYSLDSPGAAAQARVTCPAFKFADSLRAGREPATFKRFVPFIYPSPWPGRSPSPRDNRDFLLEVPFVE